VFQLDPLSQVYTVKHLAMQSAIYTYFCGFWEGKKGCSEELSEFKHATVIGCHLCSKSAQNEIES